MIHYLRQIELKAQVAAFAVSADGSLIASATEDVVALIDFESGEQTSSVRADAAVTGVALSIDNRLLAVATGAPTVRVYECSSGELIHKFIRRTVPDYLRDQKQLQVAFFPDRTRVITRGTETDVTIWNYQSCEWEHLVRMPHRNGFMVMSPDGKHIAIVSQPSPDAYRGQVTIYRVHQGLQSVWNNWHESEKGVRSAAFSPEGAKLATCTAGDGIRIWKVASGEQLTHVAEPEQHPYSGVAFRGDAEHLLTTASRTLAVYGLDQSSVLASETSRQPGDIRRLETSADGTRAVTSNENAALEVWKIATSVQERN